MPCETQAPITDLSAPTGGPPQQESSNLSAPGASLRWDSAAAEAIPQVRKLASMSGLGLGTAAMPQLKSVSATTAKSSALARRVR